jgi:hypothetical protein
MFYLYQAMRIIIVQAVRAVIAILGIQYILIVMEQLLIIQKLIALYMVVFPEPIAQVVAYV